MGLPPTPEELGLDDGEFDELVDSLPPWQRKSVLDDLNPPEPWRCSSWGPAKWFFWAVLVFINSLILLASLPFLILISVLSMQPFIGILLFFLLGSPMCIATRRLK